jgi:hypothetical protein
MNKTDKPITKLTESYLRALIIEMMNEANPYHSGKSNKEGGRFVSKADAISSGGTYSFTDNAKDDVGEDGKHEAPARGGVTSKGKVKPYFGAMSNTDKACGRLYKDGSKKPKSRRCRDYDKKAKYGQVDEQENNGIESSADLLYIKQLIKQEVEAMMKQTSQRTKSQSGSKSSKSGCSFRDILTGIQAINTAQDTPLPTPPKKDY